MYESFRETNFVTEFQQQVIYLYKGKNDAAR